MGPEFNIQKIKHKVYMTYFQDGLWDIFLGLFLLGWGFTVWFDLPWLPGAIFVAFFWSALGLKQKLTYPRIGYARPAEHRSRTLKIAVAGVVVLLAVVVILPVISRGDLQFVHNYFELLFNTILAIAFALIGYWWRVNRWYAYAALVFIFATFNQWLGLSFQMSFIVPGAIALLYGVIILAGFLRKYPVVLEEGIDENR